MVRSWFCVSLVVLTACAPVDGGADDPIDGAPTDAAPPDAEPDPDAAPERPIPEGDAPAQFGFPIHPDDRSIIDPGLFFGVDHDPAEGDDIVCTAYDGRGFPFCYDGHTGSDFVLAGGFATMDAGSARVVAAAGGRVVRVEDGNYDRCRGDLQSFEPDCDGHERKSNTVVIEHAHGWRSRYLHLMTDSIVVSVGDRVVCGDVLARVGSSGRSFAPHLHFAVLDPLGAPVDPFAGEVSGPVALWTEQRAADGLPGPACDPVWGPGGGAP